MNKIVNFVVAENTIELEEGSEVVIYKVLNRSNFAMNLKKIGSYPLKLRA